MARHIAWHLQDSVRISGDFLQGSCRTGILCRTCKQTLQPRLEGIRADLGRWAFFREHFAFVMVAGYSCDVVKTVNKSGWNVEIILASVVDDIAEEFKYGCVKRWAAAAAAGLAGCHTVKERRK